MSTVVPIRVGGELVIKTQDLPVEALELVKSALTIENEAKTQAASLRTWGHWELPDTIALYRTESRRGGEQVICLPRGVAGGLPGLLAPLDLEIKWIDGRSHAPATPGYYRPFVMRDYQTRAATALLSAQQGVIRMPSGAGKTVSVLGMMATVQQRALIIVDKVGLANQWRIRAHQFYGMPLEEVEREDGTLETIAPINGDRCVGLIGNGIWEERDLTIALRQTLVERSWSMDATKWWSTFGVTINDEVHHSQAEGLAELCRKVTSFWFGGVSATPYKSEAKGQMISALIGPLVADVTRQELYEQKVLMKTEVEVLSGDFFTEFWFDHDAKFDKETQRFRCEKPGCRLNKKHSHRNNYQSALKAIVEDDERNARIAARIMAERGHIHLVPSRQLKHLDRIRKALLSAGWPKDKIWVLRGQENAEGVDQLIVQQIIQSDEAVLLSTVADEALDIPPIDRVSLVFPMKDKGSVIQLVGRGERISPGKIDARVIDFREPLVWVFDNQYREREACYRREGFRVYRSEHGIDLPPKEES